MRYQKEIDGLRAIAVLTVIFFHAGFNYFSGGFIGVDIFFVISGYLIASIIFREISQDTFTIKNFYERRARRILPALFFVLILSIPLSYAWMLPTDMVDYSQSLITTPLFISNFLFFMESGYFDTAIEFKPLFHTWSLAVEEQFYILFPILIMALWRFGLKTIIVSISIIFLISIVLSELMLNIDRMFSFYMLPTRGWQLLIGVGISIVQYQGVKFDKSPFLNNILSTIGLALIIFSVIVFNKNSPMPGYYSLVPTIGAGLVIMFARYQTFVGRILSIKALTGIGLISYSAYLWHQPLFAFIRIYRFGDVKPGMYASAILVTLLLSYITWKFIENPFRDKSKISLKTLIISSISAGLFLVSIGIAGIITNGFSENYKARLTPLEIMLFKNSQEIAKLKKGEEIRPKTSECFIKYSDTKNFYNHFDKCLKKHTTFKVIMGDSHADNLGRILIKSDGNYDFTVLITARHCHAYHHYEDHPKRQCDLDKIIKFINNYAENVEYVIYKQRGAYFINSADKKDMHDIGIGPIKNTKLYINNPRIFQTIDYFEKFQKNIRVVWVGAWTEPLYPMHNPRKVSKYTNGKIDYIDNVSNAFKALDHRIVDILKTKQSSIIYIPLHEKRSGFIPIFLENCITFNDTNHLSSCGEKIAAPIINSKIQKSIR